MKYGDLNLGQIEAVVNKLGGMDGVCQFLSGELEVKQSEFWRVMEDIHVQILALERPTLKELRKAFPWIEKIERDTSPTEALTLQLGTIIRSDEDRIVGTEYERRRGLRQGWLGFQQAVWLVENQDKYPAFTALCGKVYIDFPGLIVVGALGSQSFPYLSRHGGRWYLRWVWTSGYLYRSGRVASK